MSEPTFADTFRSFFHKWTEEDAAKAIAADRELVEKADAAWAARDFKTLKQLDVVRTLDEQYDDDDRVLSCDYELNHKYEDAKANLSKTPAQLADEMNDALDD